MLPTPRLRTIGSRDRERAYLVLFMNDILLA